MKNEKVQAATNLINQAGNGNPSKLMAGICLLLEVYDESHQDLTPLEMALIETIVHPLMMKVETALGIPLFEGKGVDKEKKAS